jgi:uncharacterized protein YndB with AHSA1/START domain
MSDNTVRIERLIDAPPEAVFEAWTTKEAMEQWYLDGPDHAARVTLHERRAGGRYRIEFGPAGQKPYVEDGVYLVFEPPSRLQMSETLAAPDGIAWADTTVTVTFEEVDGKTRLTLVHENLPSKETVEGASGGWPGFIDRVANLVVAHH